MARPFIALLTDFGTRDHYAGAMKGVALGICPDAVLVDVRTTAEWDQIGIPDLAEIGKDVVLIEWQRYPDGSINPAGSKAEQGARVTRPPARATPG